MVTKNKVTKEVLDSWHKDPNNWIWGIFYYNRKDARIFPPKRNKYLGWTINFANPLSIFVFVAILLIIGIFSFLFK